eukprot:TRINITY_DN3193_c0_g1_i3.p1 TRINITY_DN3193_c0_g1~~TRINITY_DN3193_c0_g1_i3.p1  ORF type:complete len:545 (+),score=126.68 TRINITY_DN3193_c0_g1_i3:118-1752(+)
MRATSLNQNPSKRQLKLIGLIILILCLIFFAYNVGEKNEVFRANYSAKRDFIAEHKGYGYKSQHIDAMVANQLQRFKGEFYVDYTGSGLYQDRQIDNIAKLMRNNQFGNPHTASKSSESSEKEIADVRKMILDFFDADDEEYAVVFTSGCTQALKLVGEYFPWSENSTFAHLRENHNSVLGIRNYAKKYNANIVPVLSEQLYKNELPKGLKENRQLKQERKQYGKDTNRRDPVHSTNNEEESEDDSNETYNLFAYPAMENFAGEKYPLQWALDFQNGKFAPEKGKWLSVLDAAAYVPTNPISLRDFPVDFMTISFYKMFGYPTGIGALIGKRSSFALLDKTYFGGGSISVGLSMEPFEELYDCAEHRFEDGTVNFLSIASLRFGLQILKDLGMENIQKHTWNLAHYLYKELSSLRHSNGSHVVQIFGNHKSEDSEKQGDIVSFVVLDDKGEIYFHGDVQTLATQNKIHLRNGCHCNPGACHAALDFDLEKVKEVGGGHTSCDDSTMKLVVDGKPLGSVRVSLGYMSRFEDVEAVIKFIKSYVEK